MSVAVGSSDSSVSEQGVVIAAMYKFARLNDCQQLQATVMQLCKQYSISGTLLLAEEGINGTIAGTRAGIDAVLAFLRSDSRLSDLEHKESYSDEQPFKRMKVKLKQEIVTMGVPGVSPVDQVGTYVNAENWNELISDPDVLLLDTRNDYEFDIGTFEYAQNPNTTNFREFPDYVKKNLDPNKHKKVAMFCTGGIRCEKASSYMLQQGFEEVYHLKGGILKYLETVAADESLWKGECFVFDERVSVNHGLEEGQYDQCFGCRHPVSAEDKQSEQYQPGICCPYCFDAMTEEKRKRFAERHKQVQLAKARGEKHIGAEIVRQKAD